MIADGSQNRKQFFFSITDFLLRNRFFSPCGESAILFSIQRGRQTALYIHDCNFFIVLDFINSINTLQITIPFYFTAFQNVLGKSWDVTRGSREDRISPCKNEFRINLIKREQKLISIVDRMA